MKKFFALSLLLLTFSSFSVVGYSVTVPIGSNHFLSRFISDNNDLILPVDTSSVTLLSSAKQYYFNNSWVYLSNSAYVPVYSFSNSFKSFMVGFIPKAKYYFSADNVNHRYYAQCTSSASSIYKIFFTFDESIGAYKVTDVTYASGSVILYNSTYNIGCFLSTTSYASHSYIRFLSVSDLSLTEYIPVSSHTLTVNYLYSADKPAADPVTQTIAAGEEYSIQSPEIEGYTPSIPLVTGTMPDEDMTVDVYYTKAFYPLTLKYQYQNGSKALEDVVYHYPAGFAYDLPTPALPGYQPDRLTVAGTMPNHALEEVVIYTAKSYTLTVDYVYENGSQAAPSHTEQLATGASYSVLSPEITDYTPSAEIVSGIMSAEDVTVIVTYQKASGGSSGGGTAPDGPGSPGDGEFSGHDPFVIPGLPPYTGNDPFLIPGLPSSGFDPFQSLRPPLSDDDPFRIPNVPGPSGYDPFKIPGLPGYSYDPFVMPNE